MNLRKYQDAVMMGDMCSPKHNPIIKAVFGLAAEAGECAGTIEKMMRTDEPLDVRRLVDELGDTLWFLTNVAGHLGYSLEELATTNYQKLNHRHPAIYPDIML